MASVVGEASSSTLPSTSIPPRPRSCTYHVFLSFHGKDSRNGLTGHLHAALERKGIRTFIDNRDLEMGEVIKDELLKAIEESVFAITVLSPNYASSSWCLDELQHIVECSKNPDVRLSIVPVFYRVEPSDVRHQKGSFGKAFKEQEDRFGQNSEKVTGWRNALTEVANLSGKDFKDEHEATLVESIAEHIHKNLIPKLPSSTKNLVGIASRVEEVMRHIDIGLNDVRFISMWGMGGIGKTTIARAIYEAIRGEFKVSCFLANVREARESNRIIDKQKQLLAKAKKDVNTSDNEHDVQTNIETFLRNKKVLLVLDDVSDEVELMSLAREQDWFGSGSRIIITTRDKQVLKIYEAHETCEVCGLDDNDSSDLFCLKAFKQKKPNEKYLDLAKEVVKYSGGLPLALEVLGSHLCGRSIDVWRDAIEKIKSTPFAKIYDRLKISYDSLDDMEKNVFLDIACFFEGKEIDYVTELLETCGYNAKICIDVLVERSLVKINEESDVFEMHDLLQEMGRNIVIKESPNPGERSRLWSLEDTDLVFQNNKGSKAIQGVVLRPRRVNPYWIAEAFSNMTQLKLLIIDLAVDLPDISSLHASFLHWSDYPLKTPPLSDQQYELSSLPTLLKVLHWLDYPLETLPLSDQQYELSSLATSLKVLHWPDYPSKTLPLSDQQYELCSLPTSLKVLHWTYYPMKTLPISDQQYELVEIRLQFGRIENLWHGKKSLGKLKHLDLTGSDHLEQTPDLSEVPRLQTLVLRYCRSLTAVHSSVVHHKSLTLLDLTECDVLEALPGKLEMSSLNELILDGCWHFENLPEFGECMTSLSRLSLVMTAIKKLPTSLGCLVGLEHLNASCLKLECLPDTIDGMPLLRTLNLSYCHLTEESFPPDFGHFPSLTDLDLSHNDFVRIPVSIHELPKLKCLKLNYCQNLRCLPELPSSVRELEAYDCDSLDISEFNILSKVFGVFVSPSQDPSQVLLQMVIDGSEIPSWFVHQQDGNSISIPCDYPRNETSGIALCFQVTYDEYFSILRLSFDLDLCNGNNRFITKRFEYLQNGQDYLYIICLSKDYFTDGFHQSSRFKLSVSYRHEKASITSAARWVSKEDIKYLEKSETERRKKNAKRCLI